MTHEAWILVIMLGAILLPVVLLLLVATGDRVISHPRYLRLTHQFRRMQRRHPYRVAALAFLPAVPFVVYSVSHGEPQMILVVVFQSAVLFGQAWAIRKYGDAESAGDST